MLRNSLTKTYFFVMRRTTEDSTLERNYIQKYQFLVQEYEQVKHKQHPRYRFVTDFYKAHKLSRQTFLKYYHRYLLSKGDSRSFLPRKRGPRWHTRRTMPFIEQKVLELRDRGINRYEINSILKDKFKSYTPSPSTKINPRSRAQQAQLRSSRSPATH